MKPMTYAQAVSEAARVRKQLGKQWVCKIEDAEYGSAASKPSERRFNVRFYSRDRGAQFETRILKGKVCWFGTVWDSFGLGSGDTYYFGKGDTFEQCVRSLKGSLYHARTLLNEIIESLPKTPIKRERVRICGTSF